MSPVITAFNDGMKTKLLPAPSLPVTGPVTGNCWPSRVRKGVVNSSGRTGSGPGILFSLLVELISRLARSVPSCSRSDQHDGKRRLEGLRYYLIPNRRKG